MHHNDKLLVQRVHALVGNLHAQSHALDAHAPLAPGQRAWWERVVTALSALNETAPHALTEAQTCNVFDGS